MQTNLGVLVVSSDTVIVWLAMWFSKWWKTLGKLLNTIKDNLFLNLQRSRIMEIPSIGKLYQKIVWVVGRHEKVQETGQFFIVQDFRDVNSQTTSLPSHKHSHFDRFVKCPVSFSQCLLRGSRSLHEKHSTRWFPKSSFKMQTHKILNLLNQSF